MENLIDKKKVIKEWESVLSRDPLDAPWDLIDDTLTLLKEQEELLKHEYWRGYNNGRADERGLQEGTIMQTFSPD